MMQYTEATSSVDRRIGLRVRSRRMEIGMSQEALADVLGLTFQQVQKYEKGVNRIAASRLFDIAIALDVPVGYFYEGLTAAPGLVTGVGEDSRSEFIAETLSTQDGVQLIALFHSIKSAKVRRRVVELVRALADDEPDDADGEEG